LVFGLHILESVPLLSTNSQTTTLRSGPNILATFAAVLVIVLAVWNPLSARALDDPTAAGVVISNRAEATYQNDAGEIFSAVSPTVTVSVMAVAALVVTPDETAPSDTIAPHDLVTRLFRVCNAGNTSDSFTLIRSDLTSPATIASLYFDIDGSGTLNDGDLPIQLTQTASPQLAPKGCIGVLAGINTNDITPKSNLTISLFARSNATNTANGQIEDLGTIINAVGEGARLTHPTDADLAPSKMINGLTQAVVNSGAPFNYTIAFRNSGDTAARHVLVEDQLPASIEYVPGSLQLNDRSLSDALDGDEGSVQNGHIRVRLDHVNPAEVVRISINARTFGSVIGGVGLVNTANLTADNATRIDTSHATAVVNPFGLVFAGRTGSSAPIPGARVEILTNLNGDNLLHLPPDVGYTPNEKNENPFATNGRGQFSFALPADAIGNSGAPAAYFMKLTAQGYVTRMIQLSLQPTQAGLFALNMHALDDQPLAVAGGFDLVREDVDIKDLAALAMNVPMFETAGLRILKSADRARAEIGDIVTYRIEVQNPTTSTIRDVVVNDHLPPSFNYAAGSALLSVGSGPEQQIEPEISGNELLFRIPELPHSTSARLLYRVRIGANAREGDQENLAQATGLFPSGEQTTTATARALVYVSAGVFSTRQVIVGRVFADTNRNGQFDDSDRPMPGVRLYLTNGQSVITDSAGLYNFPSLGDGAQVISLDPISIPKGYVLSDGSRESGRTWTRLLRTPIGGGALLRQNFALVSKRNSTSVTGQGLSDPTVAPPAANTEARIDATKPPPTSPAPAAPEPSVSILKTGTQLTSPGTYEVAAADNVEAVPAGEVRILSPANNTVAMSPGLQVEARVALNWNIRLEVNGEVVSDKSIGVRSLDHKNQVSTFNFVGLSVRPGPNRISATAISPDGTAGRTDEITLMGRGPARRLQIVTDRSEIQTGGGDSTLVHVRAFDQWNNPALDGQVGIQTSLGQLTRNSEKPPTEFSTLTGDTKTPGVTTSNQSNGGQLVVQLEKGEVTLKLVGSGAPGAARLHAQTGQIEAEEQVRIISEMRPAILVGFAEMSFGKGIPEVGLRNEEGNFRSRVSFFYSGRFFGNNMLTLSYDSQRPINRTAGRDRLFQLDPLDRVYPLFGDSSTRYEAAQSNSKVYARIDHKRSYAMFGDFETDMEAPLAGYARKLTGVKAHLENSQGDFITVTGARPDTAFARDVFPAGSFGIMQLSNAEILPGSETVVLEVRDRRNPDVIISHETLARSVDYSLDPASGRLFFLRYMSKFDFALNLTQIVVTYEHRATSLNSAVYTARARKNFKSMGLKLGLSAALQREGDEPDFFLGGIDIEKTLPQRGLLQAAFATSQGQVLGSGNVFGNGDEKTDGTAYQVTLAQPLPFSNATLRARYANASAGFFNPFGGTVTPGSRRGEISLEMKPLKTSTLHFGFMSERNRTSNVDNSRLTYSAAWDQILYERVRLHFGFDHRSFTDDLNDKTTDSNLATIGADVQVTDKLQFSAKREQNLGEADPTYPTQTTLGATYQLSNLTKLFFTQRLAAAPITPIADFSGNGFASVSSRRETAVGVETRFGKYTSMTSRYQIENGINGTDSFAVIGLQNRLPISKELSLELGFERGFHLSGLDKSFNSAAVGLGWQPNSDFRVSGRYEYRDRNGTGQLIALGAAGKIREGVTALSRFQFSRGEVEGKANSSLEGTAALAIRPLNSDRDGLLFSYTHRSQVQETIGIIPIKDRLDSLSADGYHQLTNRLELYGRFALHLSANGQPQLPFVSTVTFLTQARAQYLVTRRMDLAIETRLLFQPASSTTRSTYGAEAGFWVLPDVRLGGGYNFTSAKEPAGSQLLPTRRGFYFTISSKLSNLFDLFGTSKAGLDSSPTTPKDSGSEP
jgi:uncharacterized repeat protein (TIGR01451 family)